MFLEAFLLNDTKSGCTSAVTVIFETKQALKCSVLVPLTPKLFWTWLWCGTLLRRKGWSNGVDEEKKEQERFIFHYGVFSSPGAEGQAPCDKRQEWLDWRGGRAWAVSAPWENFPCADTEDFSLQLKFLPMTLWITLTFSGFPELLGRRLLVFLFLPDDGLGNTWCYTPTWLWVNPT